MTYIPSALSKVDDNNSGNITNTFTGTSTNTTGYDTIIVTVSSTVNSDPAGLNIYFSDDNSTFELYYTDTYFSGVKYSKNFEIIKKYYYIIYNFTGTAKLTSRLSTVNNDKSDDFSYNNNSLFDAFSKLRVSNPFTLLDIKFPSQSTGTTEILENNILINNSSSTYTAVYGDSKCIITGVGDGNYINQSRKYCVYQPGKSLLFLGSGIIYKILSGTPTGFKSRIGYFDNNNGVFFEYDSTNAIGIVLRNNTSDTIVLQDNWNIDKMDGTGSSGFNLDFSKAQLFVIDLEWLGVGRIRYGFYVFGKIYYCHQIININTLNDVYMINPNLPIRYELTGTSTTGSVSLTQICSSVISEGGFDPFGRPFSINNGTTGISVSTTETPLLAIRGNSNYNHQNIIPTSATVFGTTNDNFIFRIRIYLAPNSPGTISWTNVNTNSFIEYSTSVTSFTTTGSIIVDSDYFSGKTVSTFNSLTDIFSNIIQVTSDINNVSDILVITAQAISGSGTVFSSLNWQEIY